LDEFCEKISSNFDSFWVFYPRWANLLFHYTEKEEYKNMANHAMRFLASPNIIQSRSSLTGLLLADQELASDPAHIKIVGEKTDLNAKALYQTALRYPSNYRRIEWWDRKEGPLPNPDVAYSLPVFSPQELAKSIREKLSARKAK
jgi:hypothetical protein